MRNKPSKKRRGERKKEHTHTHTHTHVHPQRWKRQILRGKKPTVGSLFGQALYVSLPLSLKVKKQKRVKLFTCTSNGKLVIVLILMSPLEWLCAIFLAEVTEVS